MEQTPGYSEGRGSLACCSPWGRKELDRAEQLNNNKQIAGTTRQDGQEESLSFELEESLEASTM